MLWEFVGLRFPKVHDALTGSGDVASACPAEDAERGSLNGDPAPMIVVEDDHLSAGDAGIHGRQCRPCDRHVGCGHVTGRLTSTGPVHRCAGTAVRHPSYGGAVDVAHSPCWVRCHHLRLDHESAGGRDTVKVAMGVPGVRDAPTLARLARVKLTRGYVLVDAVTNSVTNASRSCSVDAQAITVVSVTGSKNIASQYSPLAVPVCHAMSGES